jgi:hypothetical protein
MAGLQNSPLVVCFMLVFVQLSLLPWWWRRYVALKLRLTFTGIHGVMFQKIELSRGNLDANINTCTRKLQKDTGEMQNWGPQCKWWRVVLCSIIKRQQWRCSVARFKRTVTHCVLGRMKSDAKFVLHICYHCVIHIWLIRCWFLVFVICNMYSVLHEEKGSTCPHLSS